MVGLLGLKVLQNFSLLVLYICYDKFVKPLKPCLLMLPEHLLAGFLLLSLNVLNFVSLFLGST